MTATYMPGVILSIWANIRSLVPLTGQLYPIISYFSTLESGEVTSCLSVKWQSLNHNPDWHKYHIILNVLAELRKKKKKKKKKTIKRSIIAIPLLGYDFLILTQPCCSYRQRHVKFLFPKCESVEIGRLIYFCGYMSVTLFLKSTSW